MLCLPTLSCWGDFNLNYSHKYETNYANKHLFDNFDNELDVFNLAQVITFPTWSRNILGVTKYSILDHVYTTDSTDVVNVYNRVPIFVDHK